LRIKSKSQFIIYEILFVGGILTLFLFMKVIPFLMSVGYSLTDWNGVTSVVRFCGLENFKRLLSDTEFINSLVFTVKFTVISVILINVLGFTLAYFFSGSLFGKNIFRMGFYIPNLLGGLILGFVWQFIFVKVFPALGSKILWLATPATAFWGLVIVDVWQGAGYYMLLYIAGLTAVPGECLESADIDGASSWQKLRFVILPLIMPTITRCLFLSIVSSFKIYTLNMALTNGGPYLSSESLTMNIYRTAFTENSMGYGSAKSLVVMLIIVAVTGIQVWMTSRKEVTM
jgi:raffinose/stachyose/melibiose transport system permease protein